MRLEQQRTCQTDGTLALEHAYFPPRRREDNVIFLKEQGRSPLGEQISYFDNNYQKEGLPREWWSINDVGFSIKSQMRLLKSSADKPIFVWAEQTARDFTGFALEYLKRGTIFPFEYQIEGQELIDKKYGNRKMRDTVDPRERNGAVLESLLKMQDHLSGGGAAAIMVSPSGQTGLTMDDGSEISYLDTMVFYMKRQGDKVLGTTFRVDFDYSKARTLIKQLTGQDLPPSATVVDCVRAIALMDASSDIGSEQKIIDVMEKVKESSSAYKDKSWRDLRIDVLRRDFLYEFDSVTKQIIEDFKGYVSSGNLSDLEIQKALAATFLRLSKYMLDNQREESGNVAEHRKGEFVFLPSTHGQIVDEVKKIPGCAGGGASISSISSIIDRSTDKKWFTCPKCSYKADGPIGNTCPGCGLTKDAYAQESGEICE